MRLAVLQMRALPGDVEANLKTIGDGLRAAAAQKADLLVAPELAVTGYGAGDAITHLAETASGPSLQHLNGLVAETGTALVTGFAEAAEGAVWNSAAFLDGKNAPLVYRKSHLYGDYEKNLCKAAAPSAVTFEHAGMKIGMLICFDVEFPENVRRLALTGCDLVVVPTALPESPYSPFIARSMLPVRAFENQIFVAYANHAGADDAFRYAGLSVIAAPDGAMLAHQDDSEAALLVADLDPDGYAEARKQNSYLTDLRL